VHRNTRHCFPQAPGNYCRHQEHKMGRPSTVRSKIGRELLGATSKGNGGRGRREVAFRPAQSGGRLCPNGRQLPRRNTSCRIHSRITPDRIVYSGHLSVLQNTLSAEANTVRIKPQSSVAGTKPPHQTASENFWKTRQGAHLACFKPRGPRTRSTVHSKSARGAHREMPHSSNNLRTSPGRR